MPELRWILLAAGVALILGLWWWEIRKSRRASLPADGEPRPAQTADPQADATFEPQADAAPEREVHYPPTLERVRVPRRPPLIEIPEDLEVDVSEFVTWDRRHSPDPVPRFEPQIPRDEDLAEAANESDPIPVNLEPPEHHRAPWITTQPIDRDGVTLPRIEDEPELPYADPHAAQTAEASIQRVVALRLVATEGSWDGRRLRAAFEAEGLRFGQYSIFHRPREDGKPLLYIASMMEPGSFDLAKMDEQEFSGISLFGVVPGPLDAPSTFDLALTVGRSLAERMTGQLQDEQGSTLTAQRILNMREELVHFEHRNRRLRRD